MTRRILHLLALVALVLAGPARGLVLAGAPPVVCCCCDEPDQPDTELGPCGMPKCPARSPSGTNCGVQAPVLAAVRVQQSTQKARAAARRLEPAPWPGGMALVRFRSADIAAAPAHGPPFRRFADPQAGLRQFRI